MMRLGRAIENIMRSARVLADSKYVNFHILLVCSYSSLPSSGEHLSVDHVKAVMMAQQLDQSALWRKVTQIVMLPAKFRKLVGWMKQRMAL